jgi:endoglycosylceramidase
VSWRRAHRTLTGRRAALSLAAPVVVVALAGGLAACGTSTTPPAPGRGAAPLPWLRVVDPPPADPDRTPYLADASGRRVLLRGVAAVGMQDDTYPDSGGGPAIYPVDASAYEGKCPAASPLVPQPPLCEVEASKPAFDQSTGPGSGNDFAQMRQLGFDVVRLILNWSQLEPRPGVYDSTYLDRVAQAVDWAGQQGLYVILDMHQDQYSRFILPGQTSKVPAGCPPSGGQDGAPRWAVFTDGKPACALLGQSSLNPASSAAFAAFWADRTVDAPAGDTPGRGLQDHYIGALAALANRFENDPTVLGYELMNEPQPGSLASLPIPNLYTASSLDLYPFYRRAIEALTGVRDGLPTCTHASQAMSGRCAYPELAQVTRQQIFYEPFAWRNLLDFSVQVSAPFSAYRNLVYAPHIYTHTFTADVEALGYTAGNSPYPPSFTFGYQTADAEAQDMHSAVLVTEYGADSASDDDILAGETTAQEATLTGATLWAWKGLAARSGPCWCVRWLHSTYATTNDGTPGTGDPRQEPGSDHVIVGRVPYVSVAWPRATAGILLAYGDDPRTGSLALQAVDTAGHRRPERSTDTEIYVPPGNGGQVMVSGAARPGPVVTQPDGSRLVYVEPDPGRLAPGGGPGVSRTDVYTVTVGPAQRDGTLARVEHAAAHPLPPIGEAQARATVEAALTGAEHSIDPKVRAASGLASALGALLLPSPDPNGTVPTP